MSLAVSAFDDFTTRNIHVVSRARSSTFDDILPESTFKTEITNELCRKILNFGPFLISFSLLFVVDVKLFRKWLVFMVKFHAQLLTTQREIVFGSVDYLILFSFLRNAFFHLIFASVQDIFERGWYTRKQTTVFIARN